MFISLGIVFRGLCDGNDTSPAFEKLSDIIFSHSICHCRLRNELGPSESGVNSKIERG